MSAMHSRAPSLHTDARSAQGWAAWSDLKRMCVLALLAALPYANTLLNGFVHDDNRQVLANPYVHSFHHLPEIFGSTVWSFVGAQGVTNYYRPMMTLGYLLCFQFFGPLAYGFHLVNVLIHVAVVLVLFKVTEKLFHDPALGGIAAGLFALHPIHTESVAWIAAVTDLELTLFYLLTFGLFLGTAHPGGKRSDRVQLAMAGSYILAILSKEQALTLPLVATLYEHFFREDRAGTTGWQKLSRYGGLWLLALVYILFRIRFLGALAPVLQMRGITAYEVFLSGIALVGQYAGKLFWPAHLSAFYVFHKSVSFADPRVLAGSAVLVLSAALFGALWMRARLVAFAILWMYGALGPVLNARWMAANVFTERYLYLPSVGFCWLVAWGWRRLSARVAERGRAWRWVRVAAPIILTLLALGRIVTRNLDWHDEIRLFTRTLAASPEAYPIRINLGVTYWQQGNLKAAEREWREALKLAPKNAITLNNLGLVAMKEKRYAEAIELFRQATKLKPNYTDPHLNLGITYLEMGLAVEAEAHLRAAVALSPLNSQARNELGKLLFSAGRLREAEEQYLESAKSRPNTEAYDALGDLYMHGIRYDLATQAFTRAVSLDRFDSRAHFGLGAVYSAEGRNEDAIREFLAGLQTDPKNPQALAAFEALRREIPHAKP